MLAQMSERISKMSDRLSGDMSERMSEDMPDRMSEDMQGMSSSFVRKNAKRFFSKQFVKLGVTGRGCPRVCFDMSCWGSLKVKCSAYVFFTGFVDRFVLGIVGSTGAGFAFVHCAMMIKESHAGCLPDHQKARFSFLNAWISCR